MLNIISLMLTSLSLYAEPTIFYTREFEPQLALKVSASSKALWESYLQCGASELSDMQVDACVQAIAHSSLNPSERVKLYEFLSLGYRVSNLYKCPKGLCFQIQASKTSFEGLLTVGQDKKALKVLKVQY